MADSLSLLRCLALVGAAQLLAACASEAEEPVLPPATVRNLMLGKTIPASNVVFAAAAEPPASDQDWRQVGQSARTLAEAGLKLQLGAKGSGKDSWRRYAQAMADAALKVAKAVDKHDVDAVSAAGNQVFEACEGCHRSFYKKSETTG
ncbi:MAG: hypothetical protein D3M94_11350 [Rhodocyclales bacterium GT-UBC]|nr:MAG: hypothetical protein D3M94_11350 [Rhodocyclales bacterium GT-UBC]